MIGMSSTSNTSTFDRVHGIIEKLESAALEKLDMEKHREFVALIESDRHVLVGAKALATYVEQRFTKDTDYVVGHTVFLRARKWLKEQNVEHNDHGQVIQSEEIGIDIIDAGSNPVLQEILRQESGIPTPEALAATKYIAIVSGTRSQRKLHLDISDFIGLVTLENFDVKKFVAYLVDRYEEQRSQARDLIDRIHRGDSPITI